MKTIALLTVVLFSYTVIAQELSLKRYDTEKFTKIEQGRYVVMNPVYQYVKENYLAQTEKEVVPSNGENDCGFKQTFEYGITYIKRNCGDAFLETGEVLIVPNADRQSVLLWVESLNNIFGEQNGNMWNFDQTEYQPVNGISGGYFRIIRDNDTTKILVMSGC